MKKSLAAIVTCDTVLLCGWCKFRLSTLQIAQTCVTPTNKMKSFYDAIIVNYGTMTNIILIGDSLIADNDWQSRMSLHNVQNFGVPGATTTDVLNMLPGIKNRTEKVDIIMVMVGTNDLLSDNYYFIQTLKQIIIKLRKNHPLAEIIVSSLFPMNLPHNTIPSFNTHIETLTIQTGSCYLNTHDKFLNSKVEIFQGDGVHITANAYEIWARTLLEHIAFLIEDD